jgi:hypothetical protein
MPFCASRSTTKNWKSATATAGAIATDATRLYSGTLYSSYDKASLLALRLGHSCIYFIYPMKRLARDCRVLSLAARNLSEIVNVCLSAAV